MRECATFRPFPSHATPRGVREFFDEIFRILGERPRPIEVVVDFSEAELEKAITLDFEAGEPVFRQDGRNAAHARLGGRWLAEHDIPLVLSRRKSRFFLVPVEGDRIRVRPKMPKMWYNVGMINLERSCNT